MADEASRVLGHFQNVKAKDDDYISLGECSLAISQAEDAVGSEEAI